MKAPQLRMKQKMCPTKQTSLLYSILQTFPQWPIKMQKCCDYYNSVVRAEFGIEGCSLREPQPTHILSLLLTLFPTVYLMKDLALNNVGFQ